MLYPTERFILDASLSWLAFFYETILYGGYKPQRIRKGGIPMLFSLTGPRREVYYINFVRTHAPKRHKREQCMPFLINWKRIGVYQALFLRAGYQATVRHDSY